MSAGNVLGYWTPFSAVVVISSSVFAEKHVSSSIKQDLSLDPLGVSFESYRKKPSISEHPTLRTALMKTQGKK
jgi:hypothetical protein